MTYVVLALLALTGACSTAAANRVPAQSALPDFDRRVSLSPARRAPSSGRAGARVALQQRLPGLRVDFDQVTGAPRFIGSPHGFLTRANGAGATVSAEAAARFAQDEPHRATKAFVQEHRALFGHGSEALARAKIKKDYATAHNGLRTVVWEQQVDGIPVFEAVFMAHTTKRGELVNVSSQFVPEPDKAADQGMPNRKQVQTAPPIPARRAVALAAANLGDTVAEDQVTPVAPGLESRPLTPSLSPAGGEGAHRAGDGGTAVPWDSDQRQRFKATGLKGEIEARLVWLPMNAEELRLCWDVILVSGNRGEMFRVLVDAQSGQLLVRHCLTKYQSAATYRVFTSDSPSPLSPGHSTPLSIQPPMVPRPLVTLVALSTNASPQGWIAEGANETRGNNVDAHLDWNGDDRPDLPRPQGAPFRVFDFPLDLNREPANYSDAAVAQLFYWCNWAHDTLYDLGFTEAAGNFQTDNFGRGGLGGDALLADAQDGSGVNNANISIPPDGAPPRMQMFLFTGPTPDRDSDFDTEVVLHEYVHGLSDRLVGGGAGLYAGQAGGLGEGWSDWYALAWLSEPGDDVDGCYASGAYLSYLLDGLTENYYFGIRRYPYSTDLAKNPLTFKDIDPAQASAHPGVPLSPLFSPFSAWYADEVHRQGEVWCVTLWEARANLVRKHGFAAGNRLMLQLATDGMKLSPPNPDFVQARDALLLADLVNHGGANLGELWAAFAQRGLGLSASSPDSRTTVGVREAFDVPGEFVVEPRTGFVARGPAGGPFAPDAQVFRLLNLGAAPVTWAAVPAVAWLRVSPAGGVLATDAPPVTVTVTLDPVVGELSAGLYTNTVWITNLAGCASQRVPYALEVGQPDYFAEQFLADNDLNYQSFTFTPDGSISFYAICREPATELPTDPLGGTEVWVGDEGEVLATLSGTNTVALYDLQTNAFWISANGFVVLGGGSTDWIETFEEHFELPRISVLYDDFDTEESGGSVSWRELDDRVAVTYLGMGEWTEHNHSTFQLEWFFDGRIRLTYLGVETGDGIVGLSRGTGVPVGFEESDFTAYRTCGPALAVTLPASATEGDGVLARQGAVWLVAALATNLTVNLESSDLTELTVPASVMIPAGATNAVFDLAVVDDAAADGPQRSVVTASAGGFHIGCAGLRVLDNESAALSLSLPGHATEGEGVVQGVVRMSATPDAAVAVHLASSDATEAWGPAVVIIPAGQTSAVFNLLIVDDAELDGDQSVTVTAEVAGWTKARASLTVHDNETSHLQVLLPAEALEGQGTRAHAGVVRLGGSLPTNLVVSLASLDETELLVPGSVTVPAGQASAMFDLTLVDDSAADGAQTVVVVAGAPGFGRATNTTRVLDTHSPLPPAQPRPPHLASQVPVTTDLAWSPGSFDLVENGGFERDDFSGWVHSASGACDFRISHGRVGPLFPLEPPAPAGGRSCAVVTLTGTATAVLYQNVTVPSAAALAALSVVHWMGKDDSASGYYSYRVEIHDAWGSVLEVVHGISGGQSPPYRWTRLTRDLRFYAGRTLGIAFVIANEGDPLKVYLDDVSVEWSPPPPPCDVYFGTNAVPGPAEFLGRTTGTNFSLPPLEPLTTYYWQLVAHTEGQTPGPVWQFTTRGVAHFDWEPVPSPQHVGQPARVTVTARDELDRAVPHFTGTANLSGVVGAPTLLFRDDFEDGDFSDWSAPVEPGYVCQVTGDTAARGIYSLTMIGGWASPSQYGVARPLPDVRPSRLSFYIRSSTTTAEGGYVTLSDGSSVALRFLLGGNGTMGLYNRQGFHAVPYEAQRWYKITLALDWEGARVDYFVDDALRMAGIPWWNAVPCWREVRLYNSDYTQVWWDEFEFVEGPWPRPVAAAPASLGPFTNGVWSGDVTVLEPALHVQLLADDGQGHTGTSGTFDVVPWNDVGLSVLVSTPWVPVGGPVPFAWVVTNTGPDAAHGVVVTSTWPAHADFVHASASQGTYIVTSNRVVFDVGTLAGGASALLSGVVTPTAARMVTNVAVVTRHGAECCPANNIASSATAVRPTVRISDVAVREGNLGKTDAGLVVTLSGPTDQPVTVEHSAASQTADAGIDFFAAPGTLVIPPGQTTNLIIVQVAGDLHLESNETFLVSLLGADHAVLDDTEALGTILNDDGRPGEVHRFDWSAVPSPQWASQPFAAMLTARDLAGNVVTNFHGAVALAAYCESNQTRTIGAAYPGMWSGLPIWTGTCAQRGQVIYPCHRLSGPGRITSLALDVSEVPGQTLSNWTIRMKHTSMECYDYPDAAWEAGGWTIVCRTDWHIASTGWVACAFETPFDYNGQDHLMVDFSFHNTSASSHGMCSATSSTAETLSFVTCANLGDPLTWTGSWSNAWHANYTPNLRLEVATPVAAVLLSTVASNFVHGVWTGDVTVRDPGIAVRLSADDGNGHTGTGGPLDVLVTNDLALILDAWEVSVRAGDTQTYRLFVDHSGPADATGVVVTNTLPEWVRFVSATASQGDFTNLGNTVVFNVGTLGAGSSAYLTLAAVPLVRGTVTNRATVCRNEPEVYLANNTAEVQTVVGPPRFVVDNAAVVEGDAGATNVFIRVRLTAPSSEPMTFAYGARSGDGTARCYEDYLMLEGKITFPPGVTETNLVARVRGDTVFEMDETFEVCAYDSAISSTAYGVVTILNDDPMAVLSLSDATVMEGNDGNTNAVFTVSLSAPCGLPLSVDYGTADGTALGGSDYVPQAGSVEFPPGTTHQEIRVAVFGDSLAEADERFFVRLSPTTNVVLADAEGVGTIVNDDGAPGDLAWFEWSSVPSPQYAGWPFGVTLTARGVAGGAATSFSGSVALRSVKTEVWTTSIGTGGQCMCVPLGCASHDERTQVIYLAEEIGRAGRITGLALAVESIPWQVLSNWTLRLKHTPLASFADGAVWETEDWTVAFQTNLDLQATGWAWFPLDPPFDYNGVDNLMVDFSFHELAGYANGYCRAGERSTPRTLFHRDGGEGGDPLSWSGTSPQPYPSYATPDIRLALTQQETLRVQPAESGAFADGVWTGDLTLLEAGTHVLLIAEDAAGHTGVSLPLTVEPADDIDSDGLPDAWELRHFGSTHAPNGGPDDDADGDGLMNGQEFRAGTNPRDAASVLRIVSAAQAGDTIRVRFTTAVGKRYQLEGIDNLAQPVWTAVGAPLIGTGIVLDATIAGGAVPPARFYRVRLLP